MLEKLIHCIKTNNLEEFKEFFTIGPSKFHTLESGVKHEVTVDKYHTLKIVVQQILENGRLEFFKYVSGSIIPENSCAINITVVDVAELIRRRYYKFLLFLMKKDCSPTAVGYDPCRIKIQFLSDPTDSECREKWAYQMIEEKRFQELKSCVYVSRNQTQLFPFSPIAQFFQYEMHVWVDKLIRFGRFEDALQLAIGDWKKTPVDYENIFMTNAVEPNIDSTKQKLCSENEMLKKRNQELNRECETLERALNVMRQENEKLKGK